MRFYIALNNHIYYVIKKRYGLLYLKSILINETIFKKKNEKEKKRPQFVFALARSFIYLFVGSFVRSLARLLYYWFFKIQNSHTEIIQNNQFSKRKKKKQNLNKIKKKRIFIFNHHNQQINILRCNPPQQNKKKII